MRAAQFASVSSCTHTSPLEAFQLQFMMRTTDDLGNASPRDISQTVLWVRGGTSWLGTISFTSVRALHSLPLPCALCLCLWTSWATC